MPCPVLYPLDAHQLYVFKRLREKAGLGLKRTGAQPGSRTQAESDWCSALRALSARRALFPYVRGVGAWFGAHVKCGGQELRTHPGRGPAGGQVALSLKQWSALREEPPYFSIG
jgi:hypothetical protein